MCRLGPIIILIESFQHRLLFLIACRQYALHSSRSSQKDTSVACFLTNTIVNMCVGARDNTPRSSLFFNTDCDISVQEHAVQMKVSRSKCTVRMEVPCWKHTQTSPVNHSSVFIVILAFRSMPFKRKPLDQNACTCRSCAGRTPKHTWSIVLQYWSLSQRLGARCSNESI